MSIVVTQALLDKLTRNYRAVFQKEMSAPQSRLAQLVMPFFMTVKSNTKVEVYSWLGGVPKMVEWKDNRPMGTFERFSYTLENKDWANGITLLRNDIQDNTLGSYPQQVRGLANEYFSHVFEKASELIENGAADLCYDGKAFFATNHVDGESGSQSNKHDLALNSTNFRTVRKTMTELKNDKGSILGVRPTHLWCCSALEGTAEDILKAKVNANGATNTDAGKCEIIVIPGLSTDTKWGLVDLGFGSASPFIKQDRQAVQFAAMDRLQDTNAFFQKKFHYGADYRGNYGYGLWQLMALGKA